MAHFPTSWLFLGQAIELPIEVLLGGHPLFTKTLIFSRNSFKGIAQRTKWETESIEKEREGGREDHG